MISFCLCFAFCTFCLCVAFVFCLRAWHIHKVDKIDPVNVIKTPKKVNAAARIKREQQIEDILSRG